MPDGDQSTVVTWSEANLTLERAASLIALADGLCAIGRVRDGKSAGQFSIHNFLLRAAIEPVANKTAGETSGHETSEAGPMVVMMRACVMRRHAWYARIHRDEMGMPRRVDLPSPVDADWDWWPNVEEITRRLIDEPVWMSAVGATFADRRRVVATALASVRLVRIEAD